MTQEETGGENGASDRKDGVHFLEERGVAILYVWTMYIVLLICCHQKAERERQRGGGGSSKRGRKEDLDVII